MDKIEYYGLEALSNADVKHYRTLQKRKASILNQRWLKNKKAIDLAEAAEEHDQQKASIAYRKMRFEREYRDDDREYRDDDNDALLFHMELSYKNNWLTSGSNKKVEK